MLRILGIIFLFLLALALIPAILHVVGVLLHLVLVVVFLGVLAFCVYLLFNWLKKEL